MKCDFDAFPERRNTNCVKWDLVEKLYGDHDVIPLWVADMDFATPEVVVKAIAKRASHPVYGYSFPSEDVYQSIIDWVKRRHGWDIQKEWIVLTPGVVPALSLAVAAFSQPGDKVMVQSPVYGPFFNVTTSNGRRVVDNPLRFDHGCYTMDFDNLRACLDHRIKMLLFCSPQNPTGRVWTRGELQELGDICQKHRLLVISDEIHSDLILPGHHHHPFGSLSEELAQNSITCIAPSKTFNIAGLSASVTIIPNDRLRDDFTTTMQRRSMGHVNIFGLTAMQAAYSDGEEWLEELLVYLQGNLELVKDYFAQHIDRIKVITPEGTYLAWLDCRGLNLSQDELKQFLAKEAKVGLSDGMFFGTTGEGFLRLNFGCPRSLLVEALRRIETAVNIL